MKIEYEVIERARSGGSALERLIAIVWPEAYRVAFGILRDRGLAEDVAQEACAAIARALPKLNDPGAFNGWSYKIVVNHALAAVRRSPRTERLEDLGDRGLWLDQSDAVDLYNALSALSPVQRATVLLHYYAGLRSREIATATGLPASTVRFHLLLARRALRKALAVNETEPRPATEVISNVH